MTRYVNFVDQRKLFAAMNRKFAEIATGGLFATAVVTTFFLPTRTLSVSNAGHPPPLLWKCNTKTWSFLLNAGDDDRKAQPTNVPLGVIDAARYDRFDLDLSPGDLVLCYTDSLSESRDANGTLLSMDDLLALAAGIDGNDAANVIGAFVAAVRGVNASNLDGDDVTLLAFRPTGDREQVPWLDRLAAPGRVAKGLLASVRTGLRHAPLPEFSVKNLGGAMFPFLNHLGRKRG